MEHVRALYNDFREMVSKRRDDDNFFITHRDFLQVMCVYCSCSCFLWKTKHGGLGSLAS